MYRVSYICIPHYNVKENETEMANTIFHSLQFRFLFAFSRVVSHTQIVNHFQWEQARWWEFYWMFWFVSKLLSTIQFHFTVRLSQQCQQQEKKIVRWFDPFDRLSSFKKKIEAEILFFFKCQFFFYITVKNLNCIRYSLIYILLFTQKIFSLFKKKLFTFDVLNIVP